MKKYALCFVLLSMVLYVQAQTVVYLDETGKKVNTFDKCQTYITIVRDSVQLDKVALNLYTKAGKLIKEEHYSSFVMNKKDGTQREWYLNGKIREEENFEEGKREGVHQAWYGSGQLRLNENYKDNKLTGKAKAWYANGQLKKDANYANGNLTGQLLTYWKNGRLKRDDSFEDGKFIKGQCLDSLGNKVAHFEFEVMPNFKDKDVNAYLARNVRYPVEAQKNGVQGRVIVQFVVGEDGNLDDIKIVRGVHPDLDAEAMRVVKNMPKWIPGSIDGELVKVKYTLPINFKLQ